MKSKIFPYVPSCNHHLHLIELAFLCNLLMFNLLSSMVQFEFSLMKFEIQTLRGQQKRGTLKYVCRKKLYEKWKIIEICNYELADQNFNLSSHLMLCPCNMQISYLILHYWTCLNKVENRKKMKSGNEGRRILFTSMIYQVSPVWIHNSIHVRATNNLVYWEFLDKWKIWGEHLVFFFFYFFELFCFWAYWTDNGPKSWEWTLLLYSILHC